MNRLLSGKTKRTRFTRMCIGQSIIELMQDTEFLKIKVSSVARKAGVSRMTFYHYYDSIIDALNDYMKEIILEYLDICDRDSVPGHILEYPHLLFALRFFDQYASFFLTLADNGLHSIIIDAMNQFMIDRLKASRRYSIYELYYYAGGLLNVFLEWERCGKQQSAEEIAHIVVSYLQSGLHK
jgi:AcrR family transcriptional regulator